MAITGAGRGEGSDSTAATTFTLSPASNLTAGAMAVLSVGADNSEASGVAHTVFTVTDDAGNTWTRRVSALYDPGGINAGVEGGIFTTPQDGGTLTTSSVITVTFAVATTYKVWTLTEFTAGGTIDFVTGGANTGANTTTPTVTTSSITSGNAVLASTFAEMGTGASQTVTEDSDTTNGSWSSPQQTAHVGGSGAAAQEIATQYKITTGTGTQSYDPVLGTATDVILGWIELTESAGGGGASGRDLLLMGVGT